jgi:hypothetical protein
MAQAEPFREGRVGMGRNETAIAAPGRLLLASAAVDVGPPLA